MQVFTVLRQHIGDQFYDPTGVRGPAERQADPREVAHLVAAGVLAASENKAIPGAPETKAEAKARTKADVEAARQAQEEADRKAAEEGEAARKAAVGGDA